MDGLLASLPAVRVAVIGDFCLDAYWTIDPDRKPQSVETGLAVKCVRAQAYSLGGAGNVVANLAGLGVGRVRAVGLTGDDLFGDQIRELLARLGADDSALLRAGEGWQTSVYLKPYENGVEDHRLDLGSFNAITETDERRLIEALARTVAQVDVVIVNQQLIQGFCTPSIVREINRLISEYPKVTFIVDSRDYAGDFERAVLKLNAREAAKLLGVEAVGDHVPSDQACDFALRLSTRTGKPVFITCGEDGIIAASRRDVKQIPGILVYGETDPVGAGDTTVAMLATALGAGHSSLTAAVLANIAASITVRKIGTTGTASPDEIRAVGSRPDYVFLPELADDARHARYAEGSDIELVRDLPTGLNIRHAIYDHDGTLSVLREGWELVMQPMMVRAILGQQYDTVDTAKFHRVENAVRDFIDKTTGVQTLVQMQGLVDMVRRFGCVPEDRILDEHGYKRIYNDELMKIVRQRIDRLGRGELDATDFQLKNARQLLEALHARGIKLYLASGTDEPDVIAEAQAMGYADLFEGRIFGAVGDVKVEAKKMVLERIIREHHLGGSELATFGDGPIEIRETRKRGGVCVGVASDEIRRFGVNMTKRRRLIRAGADLIVPDYSQLPSLLTLLNVPC
ncbi:MAG: HAD family hydrolase [Phycisphaeraceae bacterium]|nr:HAD family hydrolase [Phycisphaeraceae bacterium]